MTFVSYAFLAFFAVVVGLAAVAFAAASWGHVDADAHGFVAWRKALRNACKSARHANGSDACEWAWVSMSGHGAEDLILPP